MITRTNKLVAVFAAMLFASSSALATVDLGPAVPLNVALFKSVTQSTDGFGFNGSLAVDGNIAGSSISHTNTADLNPTLTIDLAGNFLLDTVNIVTRADCCSPPERDYNITVDLLDAADAILFTSPVFNPWDGTGAGATVIGDGTTLTLDLSTEPGGGVNAHKVRVNKAGFSGSEWLHLAEVEAITNIAQPINYALNAPVTASGPQWPGAGFSEANITDGDRATFTHPDGAPRDPTPDNSSYTIDLGQTIEIDHINIVNRTGCCPDRLTNYAVEIYNAQGVAVWAAVIRDDGSNSGDGGVDLITADLAIGQFTGQFIKITSLQGPDANEYHPQIAEVEVFGTIGNPIPEPTTALALTLTLAAITTRRKSRA